jgi:hypothetical protein
MSLEKPDFEAAKAQFLELLRKCEHAQTIVWLSPKDVLLPGKRFVYVRVPTSNENEAKARQTFEEGIMRGRGVLISTICGMADSTCCYVWSPSEGEEGHHGLWPKDGGVKMTAKTESSRISGRAVRNPLLWALLRLRYRAKQGEKDLLFR